MRSLQIISSALLFLLLISLSFNLFACECIAMRNVEEEIKRSDVVLVGKVVSKQVVHISDSQMVDALKDNRESPHIMAVRYELAVQKIYKGEITTDTLTIVSGLGGPDCGLVFTVGTQYIVYGKTDSYLSPIRKIQTLSNVFWTDRCTRTKPYVQNEIDEIVKYK